MRLAQEGDIGGVVDREDRLDPEVARGFSRAERPEQRGEARGAFGKVHPPAIMQFAGGRVVGLRGVGEVPHGRA